MWMFFLYFQSSFSLVRCIISLKQLINSLTVEQTADERVQVRFYRVADAFSDLVPTGI